MIKPTTEELLDMNIINGLKELGDGDDDSFLKEIIGLYIEQAPDLLKQIKDCAAARDGIEMSRAAHTMKGASLNMGAKMLSDVCKKLESNGKENNFDDIETLLGNLDYIYDYTVTELKTVSNF